jgi:LytS/YehU family sensor histidine kinase
MLFGIWYFLRYQDYARASTALLVTIIKVVDLALMIYITNYLFIPKLLYRKKYTWFALAFIGMITVSSILKMNIIGHLINSPALINFTSHLKTRIYDNIIPHFFLVTSGVAIKLLFDYIRMQKSMAELAKEKSEAELNFLKSQINPHFLFNSLNSVYFLIDKNNAEARNALHKFSAMLRYQLYEMSESPIPIEKELAFLKDYIDLQKLRKNEHYTVAVEGAENIRDFDIEPLLLIPFVENAFKHISNYQGRPNYIKLNMDRRNGHFRFVVENSKDAAEHTTEKQGGIGLQNVKKRLALLYPGRHDLRISDSEDIFKAELSIKI